MSAKEADRRQIGKDRLLGEGEGELQNTDYCIHTPGKKSRKGNGNKQKRPGEPTRTRRGKRRPRAQGHCVAKKIAKISSPHSYSAKMGKDDVCLGCSKKFNKSESCVKCNICGLWSHKQCAGLTDELFKMMEAQIKVTGNTLLGLQTLPGICSGHHNENEGAGRQIGRL